jgi:hypothetical protein
MLCVDLNGVEFFVSIHILRGMLLLYAAYSVCVGFPDPEECVVQMLILSPLPKAEK